MYVFISKEIERLWDEILRAVISLTSPRDAYGEAAVSRLIGAAADSDVIWSSFLPHDLLRFGRNELSRMPPSSKKSLFRPLVGHSSHILGQLVVSTWQPFFLAVYFH
jgi:hypothetical protein